MTHCLAPCDPPCLRKVEAQALCKAHYFHLLNGLVLDTPIGKRGVRLLGQPPGFVWDPEKAKQEARGQHPFNEPPAAAHSILRCSRCAGTGRFLGESCSGCDGAGLIGSDAYASALVAAHHPSRNRYDRYGYLKSA